jgi:hypothetical protein
MKIFLFSILMTSLNKLKMRCAQRNYTKAAAQSVAWSVASDEMVHSAAQVPRKITSQSDCTPAQKAAVSPRKKNSSK